MMLKLNRREPAQVVQATYALDADDIIAVKEVFGPKCFKDENPTLVLKKGYSNELAFDELKIDEEAALKYLVTTAELPGSLEDELLTHTTAKEMVEKLVSIEQTEAVQNLTSMLQHISEHNILHFAYNDIIEARIPKISLFR